VTDNEDLPNSPAAERNREPIREVLAGRLPKQGHMLEIASGLGQHAVYLSAALPGWTWQPSDPDDEALVTLHSRVAAADLSQLLAPIPLDVEQPDWAVATPDAILCVNMIHIAPWSATRALFQGAGRWLRDGGWVFLYGPFRMNGASTSESNERFDADLRARELRWGIRDLADVTAEAEAAGLRHIETIAMPANNHVVVYRKAH